MTNWLQRLIVGTSGAIALGIGATITAAPVAFYATYGIELHPDPNLLSELRAPGANLAVLGAVIGVAAFVPRMLRISASLGAAVFLAYAFGRVVSVVNDGIPANGLVQATMIELVIGSLCAAVAWSSGPARSPALVRSPATT